MLCGHAFGTVWRRQDRRGLEDVWDGRDVWVPHCPVSHSPGSATLTGMVWLPCRALMAACASAWEEYFTKAHPGGTEEAEPRQLDPEKGQRGARSERRGTGGAEGRGRLPEESRVRPRNTERHRQTQSYTRRQRKTWAGQGCQRTLNWPRPSLDSDRGLSFLPGLTASHLPSSLSPLARPGQLQGALDSASRLARDPRPRPARPLAPPLLPRPSCPASPTL